MIDNSGIVLHPYQKETHNEKLSLGFCWFTSAEVLAQNNKTKTFGGRGLLKNIMKNTDFVPTKTLILFFEIRNSYRVFLLHNVSKVKTLQPHISVRIKTIIPKCSDCSDGLGKRRYSILWISLDNFQCYVIA